MNLWAINPPPMDFPTCELGSISKGLGNSHREEFLIRLSDVEWSSLIQGCLTWASQLRQLFTVMCILLRWPHEVSAAYCLPSTCLCTWLLFQSVQLFIINLSVRQLPPGWLKSPLVVSVTIVVHVFIFVIFSTDK